jgi:hypothetical protein
MLCTNREREVGAIRNIGVPNSIRQNVKQSLIQHSQSYFEGVWAG